ncbi:ParA family protein, partial [Pseudoalteromonas sp. SIMBA_162]|uniref:ParA family protein n=1 Tax=Pseudoalteromonas sp. SIMBA_162 TaxID=3080867 RepID=UPI00397DFC54
GKNPDEFAYGLYDVLIDGIPAEHTIVNVPENIDIIPATVDIVGFDFEVIGNSKKYPRPFELMYKGINHLRSQYDFILIDTPPSLALMVGNVFTVADGVLIPYAPETYSMRSLIKVIETIQDFKDTYNPDLQLLGVVATLVKTVTTLHTEILDETRKYL